MYNYLYWVSLCKPLRIISLNSVKLATYLILLFFSHSVMSDSLPPLGLQHARLPCPSPSPGACSLRLKQLLTEIIPISTISLNGWSFSKGKTKNKRKNRKARETTLCTVAEVLRVDLSIFLKITSIQAQVNNKQRKQTVLSAGHAPTPGSI